MSDTSKRSSTSNRSALVKRSPNLQRRLININNSDEAAACTAGVQHVEVNRLQQKVAVTGEVDPVAVLRRAQSTGKKAEPWPGPPEHCRLLHPGGRGPLRHWGGPAAGPSRQVGQPGWLLLLPVPGPGDGGGHRRRADHQPVQRRQPQRLLRHVTPTCVFSTQQFSLSGSWFSR